MASKASLDKAIRLTMLEFLQTAIEKEYDTDVLTVPASDTGESYDITVPVLDAEGNEKWLLVKVSVPRGKRQGGTYLPYDGYALHDEYVERMETKEEEKKAKAKEKEE